jgi:threonylcarbamoyladenosine tRNA methylthiotransferase MtaB
MTVAVHTFGCRLNTSESEVMRTHARAAGLSGLVVVNTCAVTAEAVRQARQAIRKAKRENPAARLVVTGCAAQVAPQDFAAMPEVDRVLGNSEKLDPTAWQATGRALTQDAGARADLAPHEKSAVSDIMAAREAPAATIEAMQGRTRAFVQVQTGCDHRCTFCIIPFGRGNSRSVPVEAVVSQVSRLNDNGYREVVLTGVDLTSYGTNLPDAPRLGRLVKRVLAGVPNLQRLRLSSIDSIEADPELIDAFANEPRLMPHLHLSLQAGDDLILKRMKRRHTRGHAIAFCATLRRLRPDIVFGADLIAGFPTETEDMHARSLDLIEDCGLTFLHVFPFSPRPGTPAARMPAVARDIVKERARQLREKGAAALRAHLDGEVGRRRRVLVETQAMGRTEQFAEVRLAAPLVPGAIADLALIGHDGRRLAAA